MALNPDADLQKRLWQHLQIIAQPRDPYWSPAGHRAVQKYITTQLQPWGEVEQLAFRVREQEHYNYQLRCLPQSPKAAQRPPILVGAHYDAVPASPGADDNATGLAVLLELVRSISQLPLRRPLWFVAFDLEEQGLLGSRAYAHHLRTHGQPLRLMLSLEMLGYCNQAARSQRYPAFLDKIYPDRGNFIGLIGNVAAIGDLLRLHLGMRSCHVPCQWLPAGRRGLLVPDTRRSDHASFWDQGYRAVMVTDTANLRNPHYHRLTDTLDTLNLDFLTSVCRGIRHAITHL
ncbi:MAG: M28 family peptidase [Synechococcaceae cyanobacterium SM2_3_1]|nr:M28 family peptidase [Synechococcaceae cyanobacterium SM2_3_1]